MPTEHPPTDRSLEEQQEKAVARRQLIKILIAAGSVFTASSVLPTKWIRPIVELGMLPSHAQASVVPMPLCYTATPSHTPTPTPRPMCYTQPPIPTCYTPTVTPHTQTQSSTATPTPATPQARRQLLDRLLAEGRFPPDIAREL
jgi:hypothetical protein